VADLDQRGLEGRRMVRWEGALAGLPFPVLPCIVGSAVGEAGDLLGEEGALLLPVGRERDVVEDPAAV